MDSSARQHNRSTVHLHSQPARSSRPVAPAVRRWKLSIVASALTAALGLAVFSGCSGSEKKKAEPPAPKYPVLPPKQNLPEFMKGTIFELTDVDNKTPYEVSGFGLVVGLMGTGNNSGTPLAVRNHMIDEMVRHGFGSADSSARRIKPERMIQDNRTAIVEIYAYLPPGARSGQRMDVFVQAAAGSQTTSLVRGMLYQTDLSYRGADPLHPKGSINIYAKAKGPVFVNPAYVTTSATTQPVSPGSLRNGMIMNGGMVLEDRPMVLRLRAPELRVARSIEMRIDQRFQDETTAKTKDEGIVYVLVPHRYNGDWEHFMGVVTHMYLNGAPGFGVVKAKALVQEALKPDALLQDISYCWEAIGPEATPFIQPLYAHQTPEVAFAAARAGAFIGDVTAEEALLDMAKTDNHAFQLNAVKTLGAVGESSRVTRMLRELLTSKNTLVRIEAYRILAEQGAPPVHSRPVRDLFYLDQIPCEGAPLVYATRSGVPRIAIFGQSLSLKLPIMFSAMGDKFTMSSTPDQRAVVMFDRTGDAAGGTQARVSPELAEIVYRLSGGGGEGFAYGYSDLVGILQALSSGQHIPATFVLQDPPVMQETIEDAPPIGEPEDTTPAATPPAATAEPR